MLSDPLSSTSVSTQQDQQLNFCPKTVPIFQLSTLEDPSHLRLLWVGAKLCLNPRRMTSGKDTWTSPCRTKPHTATQAPDCKRKWGFGQLFLEQHDSALISWNNPFDWERLRSVFPGLTKCSSQSAVTQHYHCWLQKPQDAHLPWQENNLHPGNSSRLLFPG